MKKTLLKQFVTTLLIFGILSSSYAFSSINFEKVHFKSMERILLRQYSMNIQSPTYYIGGCTYTYTAVLTFEWDGIRGHLPTNVQITNAVLNQHCPNAGGFLRNISTSCFTDDGEIKSIAFSTTGDQASDSLLVDTNFNNDIKTLLNEEIKKITGQ